MNAPPEGLDTSEEVRNSAFPCVSVADLLEKKKESGRFFRVRQNTSSCMLLGAACVFSLRDSRLMQNKRASLNIQQEKLQSQHSIWSLLLCGTISFHISDPSLPFYTLTVITSCVWSFFILAYYSLSLFSLYISSSCIQNDGKEGNILSTNCRQPFYLFIMKYIGNKVLKMKHIACYRWRIKRKISSAHTSFRL